VACTSRGAAERYAALGRAWARERPARTDHGQALARAWAAGTLGLGPAPSAQAVDTALGVGGGVRERRVYGVGDIGTALAIHEGARAGGVEAALADALGGACVCPVEDHELVDRRQLVLDAEGGVALLLLGVRRVVHVGAQDLEAAGVRDVGEERGAVRDVYVEAREDVLFGEGHLQQAREAEPDEGVGGRAHAHLLVEGGGGGHGVAAREDERYLQGRLGGGGRMYKKCVWMGRCTRSCSNKHTLCSFGN
jgi:hypothetical protein